MKQTRETCQTSAPRTGHTRLIAAMNCLALGCLALGVTAGGLDHLLDRIEAMS
jgi:hypothetical protein